MAETSMPVCGVGGDVSRCCSEATIPEEVTKAITLRGAQLSWAVLQGIKTIENRNFRIAPGW